MKQLYNDGTVARLAAELAVDIESWTARRATGFHGFKRDTTRDKNRFEVRLSAQVDPEGRLGSGAGSKLVSLLYCSSDVEAAAAWDLALLWRRHHLPAMKIIVHTPNFNTDR